MVEIRRSKRQAPRCFTPAAAIPRHRRSRVPISARVGFSSARKSVSTAVLASRRAGLPRPGRVRPVQVERPTGRTTWTGRARSGCLWCATGSPASFSHLPGAARVPGRVALAAGGLIRVVGPEALPAGGKTRLPGRSRLLGTSPTFWPSVCFVRGLGREVDGSPYHEALPRPGSNAFGQRS